MAVSMSAGGIGYGRSSLVSDYMNINNIKKKQSRLCEWFMGLSTNVIYVYTIQKLFLAKKQRESSNTLP